MCIMLLYKRALKVIKIPTNKLYSKGISPKIQSTCSEQSDGIVLLVFVNLGSLIPIGSSDNDMKAM